MEQKHLCAVLVAAIMILGSLSVALVAINNQNCNTPEAAASDDLSSVDCLTGNIVSGASGFGDIPMPEEPDIMFENYVRSENIYNKAYALRCEVNFDVNEWADMLYNIGVLQDEQKRMYDRLVDLWGHSFETEMWVEEVQKNYGKVLDLVCDNYPHIVFDAISKHDGLKEKADEILREYQEEPNDLLAQSVKKMISLEGDVAELDKKVDFLTSIVSAHPVKNATQGANALKMYKNEVASGLGSSYDTIMWLAKEEHLID